MVQAARAAGRDISEFAMEMSLLFKGMCNKLEISYDKFIQTSDPENHVAATALWRAMEASGDLYLDRYEGWYSVRDEAYYDAEELHETADGLKLSPQGTPVEWTEEESWFFRLSKYQQRLLELYEQKPGFLQPDSRRNETIRFVEGGLSDLSVSRTSFDWGVPVPGSPGHVMYVWVDALINYASGLGWPDEAGDFARYWPADIHNIGKDIVRFHAVYWPAFLMSAGVALPEQVFGHGFLLNRGEKMSKSLGNVTDPLELADRHGVDQLRYFLLREVAFGGDGSYSEEAIVTRCNADLANNLGNLAQRSLSMIAKNCDGCLPTPGVPVDADVALIAALDTAQERAVVHMDSLVIHQALEAIWEGASAANLYFAGQAPWALRKTDPARADTVLYYAAEAVRRLAIMVQWAVPNGSGRLLDLLAVPPEGRAFASLGDALEPGTRLPEPVGVFPRLALGVSA